MDNTECRILYSSYCRKLRCQLAHKSSNKRTKQTTPPQPPIAMSKIIQHQLILYIKCVSQYQTSTKPKGIIPLLQESLSIDLVLPHGRGFPGEVGSLQTTANRHFCHTQTAPWPRKESKKRQTKDPPPSTTLKQHKGHWPRRHTETVAKALLFKNIG